MKSKILLFAFCTVLPFVLQAQDAPKYYYVVIGGFAVESNAEKFSGYVRANRYNATYDYNSERKLSYVYVLKTEQKDEAFDMTRELQVSSEFKDAWVFYGTLDRDRVTAPAEPPAIKEEPKETPTVDTTAQVTQQPEPQLQADTASAAPATDALVSTTSSAPEFDPKMVVKGKLIRFVIEDPDGKLIPGAVHHVDYSKGRDIATFEAGKYLDILPPNSANNPMTIVCAIFGYKEVVKEVDYNQPQTTAGAMRDEHNAWVIPYKLEPLNTGDVSVMYRVSFYKDAVVMLPPSKAELDQLVNMMNANPNYRIKIHGHCNGTNSRRIIALGASKNYFDMAGSNEIKGSAKELSRLRAVAVQTYLADHGIDVSRTELYAWGGSNMLAGETSTSAKLNDRIEIEIMKH
jgi:outer membrane protein OmpA-like peptidoglycan-associated protein